MAFVRNQGFLTLKVLGFEEKRAYGIAIWGVRLKELSLQE